jgi:vacuolar-type H+-ATPase subunit H
MAYAVHLKLEELEKDNKELRTILEIQAGQIERNKQTIYLYAGGLYNRKEREILEDHLNILAEESFDEDYKTSIEDQIESVWPRTRQGIMDGTRLTALEEKIQAREEAFSHQLEVLEDNLTQIFKERDEQLTEFEAKLKEMETKINAMEKMQLERLGLPL